MPDPSPATRSPFRSSVENASRGLLARLHALPRLLIPVFTVLLFAVGVLASPAIGVLALIVVLVFFAWLAYLSWPAVSAGGRFVRVLLVVLVAGLIVFRLWQG